LLLQGTSGTSVMAFEIHRGYVSAFEKAVGRYAGSPSFSLNDPLVVYYSPSPTGGLPLDVGDYVAVAVKRALVPNAQYVALAYRKIWAGESAHALNAWWPASCAVIGTMMFGFWSTEGIKHVGNLVPLLSFGSIGAFGIVRLISMRSARRALDALESPLDARARKA